MELILINENKLKIMLTAEDMTQYDISAALLESDGDASDVGEGRGGTLKWRGRADVARAFRGVFDDVRRRCGFDTDGGRVLVRLYPSRDGGCEVFVTRLDRFGDHGAYGYDIGDYSDTDTDIDDGCGGGNDGSGDGNGAAVAAGHGSARSAASNPGPSGAVYSFTELPELLAACRLLGERGMGGRSGAYVCEDGRYLLFTGLSSAETEGVRAAFLDEYGRRESGDGMRVYISEHARRLADGDAAKVLGGL